MQERVGTSSGQSDLNGSEVPTTRRYLGAVAVVLLLGGSAVSFVTVASAEARATAAGVLISVGLVGLLLMACAMAARLARARAGGAGGGGPGGGRRGPMPVPSGDPDAELLRILDDARLGDSGLARQAPLHNHRDAA